MSEETAVRKGEEIDAGRLSIYISDELGIPAHEISVRQFPSGSSNLTYAISAAGRDLVLRRPPFGNTVRSAHDMAREFRVLNALCEVYPLAPRPLAYSSDEAVLGSEFYLMERREGLILRGTAPAALESDPELQTAVCRSFAENLADLHSVATDAAGLGDFGNPDGYVGRQVTGWSQRYFKAKTDEWEELERAIFWMNNNVPDLRGASLVHNDYKFDNLMLDPEDLSRIVAVLDWEMATVGDPLLDLGTTLGYWMDETAGETMMSLPFNPKVLMSNVTRCELAEMYLDRSGRSGEHLLFCYVFGTVKVAVIAQQIYSRFKRGFTRDERFAHFDRFVNALGIIALRAIQRGNI